ncbi:dTDP-4-amino-4,6-dideoxygalactose transaminase [marine bacterium AO1-C]|nr:dTDP-4-amino-4,6-dideoxygalactose transaminase [marine bacterium AO1-C]
MRIPFNKPFLTGKETDYIRDAVASGKISGDGVFTQKCHQFFEERYGFGKCLLTTSCTDALEMAAILLDTQPGDEVIAPAYTFVSTVNAFVLRGARIVFADSQPHVPNIDIESVASLINPKTKAIVVVHYAGVACDMEPLLALANKHNLLIVEDCAHAIDSFYQDKPLGSLGHLGAFSFHETKNVIAGEGGMLTINDERLMERAEIIREKGTNRSAFFRGEVDKYGWVDIGSSFLPSDIIAAFLYAQLENLDNIQARRKEIWQIYHEAFQPLQEAGLVRLSTIPDFATNNAHMFYLVCHTIEERNGLIEFLKQKGIWAVFHYLSLHHSPYYTSQHDGRVLPNCDRFADCLVRLPFYYELNETDQREVIENVQAFFNLRQTNHG